MKLHRIYAVVLRHIMHTTHNLGRMMDIIFWPTLELLIWGITSKFIAENTTGVPNLVTMILSGIIFWIIVYRNQNIITVSLLEEFWNRSLLHYFIAPMKFFEYILGVTIFAMIKLVLTFIFMLIVAYFLYDFNLFIFGFHLIPFLFGLLLMGWWVGFFVMGMILRYGAKIEILAWSFVAIISPFSAIYYPVSILPQWAQYIAYLTPSSYIFEGMREVIATGVLDTDKIFVSYVLNIIFLVFSLVYLKTSFRKVLDKGLVKVF